MARKWDNTYSGLPVKWFILYNKEAHLEWQAKTYDERIARAKWHGVFGSRITKINEYATVLVDKVENKLNTVLGANPNGVTIVDPSGKIIFYQDWFRYGDVDKFLGELFKDKLKEKSASTK